jgi:hypothetical protein
MDNEQRKQMAYRTVFQQDEGQGDISYTIEVSGDKAELRQITEHPWENEQGTDPDVSSTTWVMSKDVFKKLLEAAQWCIEKSEAMDKEKDRDHE